MSVTYYVALPFVQRRTRMRASASTTSWYRLDQS